MDWISKFYGAGTSPLSGFQRARTLAGGAEFFLNQDRWSPIGPAKAR